MVRVQRGWLPALVIVFWIAMLQGLLINQTYMREDEEIAFRTTSQDLSFAIWYQAASDVQAPFWFGAFWLWQQFAGSTEFAGRWLGLLTTLLTLPYVYRLSRAWFGADRFGWFALLVLGVGGYFTAHAMEIRPYPLILLLAVYSTYCLWRWLHKGTWRSALVYGLSLALALYTHYFLGFLIIGHAVYILFAGRAYWRQALVVGSLAVVAWLPWSVVFISQLQVLRRLESVAANDRGLIGIGNTTEPTTLNAILALFDRTTNGLAGVYLVLLLVSLLYGWRRRGWWLAFLWGIGVPAFALLGNLVASVYTQRYVSYLSIGFAILIAYGLASLRMWLRWPAVIAVTGLSIWMLPGALPENRIPFRDLFRQVTATAESGDVLYFTPADHVENLINWHLRAYLSSELRSNQVDSLDDAAVNRRVWFVTPDWFNESVQAEFKHLERTHPLQQVVGQCDRAWCYLLQLMEAPPATEPTLFGSDMAFWGLDVDAVTAQTIRLRLWWRVARAPLASYSLSVRLIDSAGNLLAQNDGPINHYGQGAVDSSLLEPGQLYIDWRQLDLPPGLAAGTYQLTLAVYDWQTGERLTLANGTDVLTMRSLEIPGL